MVGWADGAVQEHFAICTWVRHSPQLLVFALCKQVENYDAVGLMVVQERFVFKTSQAWLKAWSADPNVCSIHAYKFDPEIVDRCLVVFRVGSSAKDIALHPKAGVRKRRERPVEKPGCEDQQLRDRMITAFQRLHTKPKKDHVFATVGKKEGQAVRRHIDFDDQPCKKPRLDKHSEDAESTDESSQSSSFGSSSSSDGECEADDVDVQVDGDAAAMESHMGMSTRHVLLADEHAPGPFPNSSSPSASSSSGGGAASSSSSSAPQASPVLAGVAAADADPSSSSNLPGLVLVQKFARATRGLDWGPFKLAPVFSAGIMTGYGATCGRHHDAADGPSTTCKIQVTFGKVLMSEAEARLRVKLWCIAGVDIPDGDAFARTLHLQVKPRHLDINMSEDEADRVIASLT